ncbi:hypothetical protein [Novosphingobium pentaromativorans]|uniref:hypothetical protein n=1 Tax=Novosphingobium pentaromativorans TaxID=205844 RepID=UPI003082A051
MASKPVSPIRGSTSTWARILFVPHAIARPSVSRARSIMSSRVKFDFAFATALTAA